MMLKNNSNFANFTNLSQHFFSYIAAHPDQAKGQILHEEKCKINILSSLDHCFIYNPVSVCSPRHENECRLSFTCRSLVSLGYQLSLFQLSSIYSQLQQLSVYLSNIGIKTTYQMSKILLDWNFNLKYYLNTDFTLDSSSTRLQIFNDYKQQISTIFNPFIVQLSEIDKLEWKVRQFSSDPQSFLIKSRIYQQLQHKQIKSTDCPQLESQTNSKVSMCEKLLENGCLKGREQSTQLRNESMSNMDQIRIQTSPQISFCLSSSTDSDRKLKDRQPPTLLKLVDNINQSQLSIQKFEERVEVSDGETEDSNKNVKCLQNPVSQQQNLFSFLYQNPIFCQMKSINSVPFTRNKQVRLRQLLQQEAKQCMQKAKIAVKKSRALLTAK